MIVIAALVTPMAVDVEISQHYLFRFAKLVVLYLVISGTKGVTLWSYHPRYGKISIINRAMKRIEDEIVVLTDANV